MDIYTETGVVLSNTYKLLDDLACTALTLIDSTDEVKLQGVFGLFFNVLNTKSEELGELSERYDESRKRGEF